MMRTIIYLLGLVGICSFQSPKRLYSAMKSKCLEKKLFLFEGVLEDFVGKKYGAGQYFYGVRTSSEQQVRQSRIALRPNAVLVVGAPESCLCQSVLIELLEKGFAVRYACDDSTKAFQTLGPSGHNFDIVELHKGSFFGRASSEKDFAFAVQDIQAIVLCLVSEDKQNNFNEDVYKSLSQKVVDISSRAQQAGVLSLKKIVLVSDSVASPRAPAKSLKMQLLNGGTDFVVVHAHSNVISSKVGSDDDLEVHLEGDMPASLGTSSQSIVSADLAEVTVQALLQDIVSNTTISVHSVSSESSRSSSKRIRREAFYRLDPSGDEEEEFSVEKASRDAACRQLGAWDAVRPLDQIRKQLAEDEAVEKYWTDKFKMLAAERNK